MCTRQQHNPILSVITVESAPGQIVPPAKCIVFIISLENYTTRFNLQDKVYDLLYWDIDHLRWDNLSSLHSVSSYLLFVFYLYIIDNCDVQFLGKPASYL